MRDQLRRMVDSFMVGRSESDQVLEGVIALKKEKRRRKVGGTFEIGLAFCTHRTMAAITCSTANDTKRAVNPR